jgi:WD40 repeat protein
MILLHLKQKYKRVNIKRRISPSLPVWQRVIAKMGQLGSIAKDFTYEYSSYLSAVDVLRISCCSKTCSSWAGGNYLWQQLFTVQFFKAPSCKSLEWKKLFQSDYCWQHCKLEKFAAFRLLFNTVSDICVLGLGKRIFCCGHDGRLAEFIVPEALNYESEVQNYKNASSYREANGYSIPIQIEENEWARTLIGVGDNSLAVGCGSNVYIYRVDYGGTERLLTENLSRLAGHRGAVHSLAAYNADHVVSTSFDCSARLWDLEAMACRAVFSGHEKQIYGVLAVPPLVATASYDKTVRVYDTRSSNTQAVDVLGGHNGPAWYLKAASKEDFSVLNRFYSSCSDGCIREWDLRNSSRPVYVFEGDGSATNDFLVDYDKKRLVCGYDNAVCRIFSTHREKSLLSSVIPNKNTLCRYIRKVGMLQTNSPNHKYCFADNTGCISMVCETDLERPFKLIPRPIMPIRSMICTGERIFFGGFDGSVGCCGLHTKWAID